MRYYCTYFDRNYLIRALALIESLQTHEKGPFTIFAVCLDELTRVVLTRLAWPSVVPIALHEIEAHDAELTLARSNRDPVEYYWTLTPTVILRLLERNPHIDLITYVDADLYFYSSPEPIFTEMGTSSILIHEHRFHEEFKPAIIYGRFNVGLLCFRNDERGRTVLRWWRERCNEWCHNRLEDGKFGDQLYLDAWPDTFPGVHVLGHIGAGVAPWNHLQYHFEPLPDGGVSINGLPLVFYHFHALLFRHPHFVMLSKLMVHRFTADIILLCYLPYIRHLLHLSELVRSLVPDFDFGLTSSYWNPSHAAIIRDAASVVVSSQEGDSRELELLRLDENLSLLVTEQVVHP